MKLLALILCIFASVASAQTKPNIVFIMVDDFSMNLMPSPTDAIVGDMPQLAKMMRDGVTFSNYFVTDSLCCPSRASMLTGMMPHNTGVRNNEAPYGGQTAFTANGNEAKTFALPMQTGGYKTAYMGKYLNGWLTLSSPIPPGWNRFVSTSLGYKAYGYPLNDNGVISYPPDHFTDLIAEQGRLWITQSRQPFFLALAPFGPHSPYVPAVRHEGLFLDVVMPKTPAYDRRPGVNTPNWLRDVPPLTASAKALLDNKFILRKQTDKGIDEMIGKIRNRLVNLGIADSTYIVFTSDNGYHLGEFSMGSGKQSPFEFDIHVPMVIVGPGIAPGSVVDRITMNIDIMPMILELAGLPVPATVDGRSLLTGAPRSMAAVEHLSAGNSPDDPDYTPPGAGLPPSYTALRGVGWMYVEYATGEVGYYDLIADPHQLYNVASSLTTARLADLHAAILANGTCVGAVQCAAAQNQGISP